MGLAHVLESNKTIRSIGFDDAPFERGTDEPIGLAGIVCEATRFDGMVWGTVTPDGWDADDTVFELLEDGKFLPQLHVVLVDGVAFGGFNVLDIEQLADRLGLPVIAVMRNEPDFERIEAALEHVSESKRRLERMRRAGTIYEGRHLHFQVQGMSPELARQTLDRLRHEGHMPEPLRIAHLVASAVGTGESGRRA